MKNIYDDNFDETSSVEIKKRGDLKQVYFSFLSDFKKYLVEYIRESSVDLTISAIEVTPIPRQIFSEENSGLHITLKNQGSICCFLTTDKEGGYRLDPNESQQFWLNTETLILTLSGTTTVGYIRS